MAETSIYKDLAAKMGAGKSERFIKILEASFTPEEASVCGELQAPATCQEVALKLKLNEKKVSQILDKLVDKGALTRGATQFAFHTSVMSYHHESVADTAPHVGPNAISRKIKDLWIDYFHNELSYQLLEEAEHMIKRSGRSLPISPAIGALERSKNLNPDDIMLEENFKKRIEQAKHRIMAPCGCRISWGVCKKPMMTCFACFDRPRGEYYFDKPGRVLKEYTLPEVIDLVLIAEDAGLVHWGDCYCCDCCCENLFPVTRSKRFDLMTPNRFLAVVDEDKCKGCQVCVERCKFEAIEMKQSLSSKKFKANIKPESCKGCGLCVTKCQQDAISLVIARPPEYLKPLPPPNAKKSGEPVHVIPVGWGHYNLK